jgi:hypothetical protein
MIVDIFHHPKSAPIKHYNVQSTFVKDSLFWIVIKSGVKYKYPLDRIFRIVEFPNGWENEGRAVPVVKGQFDKEKTTS